MKAQALQSKDTAEERVLYMAMDLSKKRWRLVFGDGRRRRQASVEGRNLVELGEALDLARERFELPADVRVVSCYEAGRDGFWLHRYLTGMGVENRVVDSSSIEVNRRKRQAKTDRLDGDKLLTMLIREEGGEREQSKQIAPLLSRSERLLVTEPRDGVIEDARCALKRLT